MIGKNVDIAAVVILLAGVALFVHVRDALLAARLERDSIIFSKPPEPRLPELPTLPHIRWHSD